MNKAERAALDVLIGERDAARALSWPVFPRPVPMDRPDYGQEMIHGWSINTCSVRISEEWQDGMTSYRSNPNEGDRYACGSRDCLPLFATKREAYLALYYDLAIKHANELARVLKLAESEE